jgi:hypothetical protein
MDMKVEKVRQGQIPEGKLNKTKRSNKNDTSNAG